MRRRCAEFSRFFTARHSIALRALYMLGKSVRMSVTLRYCVKMGKRRGMWSSPPGSPVSLASCCQKWLLEYDPVLVKFEYKEVYPCENSRAVNISPHNSGTVTDSEKSSIKMNKKLTTGFPTSHQSRSCVTPNFPKMGFKYPNLTFFAQISTKKH